MFSGMASPANTKLGLRMTTLHEEPSKSLPRKHSFDLLTDDTIEEQTEEGRNGKTEVHVSVILDKEIQSGLFIYEYSL